MAYQSLYRRYRPQKFGEVRGQDHLVKALRNAVADDRVGHAYLFSGPRGTGKTTTARILAKALNCESLTDGEPCGTCASCQAIEAGTSFDLQELDAASNRGIGEMRALLDTIALGTPGRTKVYILDEVHMLTKEASAALLKTLEEPPGHVVFVLATTDPHKVLPTIRSRTQHVELHLLPADELSALVQSVVEDASLELTPEQINYALRKGGGSARDTLSVLDQVASAGAAPDHVEATAHLIDGIADQDVGAVLAAVQDGLNSGREPRVIGEELLEQLRDAFLVTMGVELTHLPEGDVDQSAEVGRRLGARSITRALEALGEALIEMRQAADPRIPLEVALMRITRPESDQTISGLAERLDRIERQLASGDLTESVKPSSTPEPQKRPAAGGSGPAAGARKALTALGAHKPPAVEPEPAPEPAVEPAPEPAVEPAPEPAAESASRATVAGLPTRDELTLAWADVILAKLSQKAKSRWAGGRFIEVAGAEVVFGLPNDMHAKRCEETRSEVEEVLEAYFGRPVPMRLTVDNTSGPPADALETAHLASASMAPAEPATAAEVDDVGSVAELDDADITTSGVDRLTDAFPGAELVKPDDD